MPPKATPQGVSVPVSPSPEAPLPETFEAAMAELTRLVSDMEAGSMSLAESLAAYERGKRLERFCQEQLQIVEDQLKLIDAQGNEQPLKLESRR
ncbi:exodeoxyribonuclease VII small subunit [Piscinibacterium candidicorallinum]|jgi:exodeoxyribonuclease VII small subunit|uniref:exodeoxyribonuclease VII small subunit n=1 Tax=Piscinibacterium candidicorallinum TaxID=1793872 RepID=UPI0036708F6A